MQSTQLKYLFAGGCVAASVAVATVPESELPDIDLVAVRNALGRATVETDHCEVMLDEQALISRHQLSELTKLSPGASIEQLKTIIPRFHCELGTNGDGHRRFAMPVAFELQPGGLAIIILVQGDRYAGYDFLFR